MPKRTNEQSQSEPAAKRFANSSSHEDLLVEAQASLDRLDFKTTEAICSEIIDSNPKDVHQPLLMRSISLGKRNRPYEAVQDVERALNSKKSVETHLRAAFAYLGIVQHHLNLAKGHFVEGEDPATSLPCQNVMELEESIQEAKDLEKRGSLKRVSPELFIKIVSFCDSPSLMRCARVSKQFNQSILGDEGLFKSFTMRGNSGQISRGLQVFVKRCNNSLRSLTLEVLGAAYSLPLEEILSGSRATLRSLKVGHSSHLGSRLLLMASQCPSLKVFASSQPYPSKRIPHSSFPDDLVYQIDPSTWKPQLETFIMTCGYNGLIINDVLLSVLHKAKVVKINSVIPLGWIVKLVSSNSSLVTLEAPFQQELLPDDAHSIEIPELHLPHLSSLQLGRLPQEKFTHGVSPFLGKLGAPSLQHLSIGEVGHLGDFQHLKCGVLRSLTIGLDNLSEYVDLEEATHILVSSFQGDVWNSLQRLCITAKGQESSEFYKCLLEALTPHSKEHALSEYKNILLLPQLRALTLSGGHDGLPEVDLADLASFVASRKAIHNRLSIEDVVWSANGNFNACNEASENSVFKSVSFKSGTPQLCSQIESIDITNTNAAYSFKTRQAFPWLLKNVDCLDYPASLSYLEDGV